MDKIEREIEYWADLESHHLIRYEYSKSMREKLEARLGEVALGGDDGAA